MAPAKVESTTVKLESAPVKLESAPPGAAAVPGQNPARELAGGEGKRVGEREGDEGYPSVASVEARGGRRGVLR